MPEKTLIADSGVRVICDGLAHYGESTNGGVRYFLRVCDCAGKKGQ